jgi:hypothetical protein
MEKHRQQSSIGYFIIAFALLWLIQNYFFSPSVEVLSYGSIKTLLVA